MAIPTPKVSEIMGLIKKGMTIEAQEKIMELREAVLEYREENLQLKKTISELECQIDIEKCLKYEYPVYYKVDPDSSKNKDGPYCRACYDKDKKLIRLTIIDDRPTLSYHCNVCKNMFFNKSKDRSQDYE